MDHLSLGPVPGDEDCAQVGQPDYYTRARAECRRHIRFLRSHFGQEPEGARFCVTSNPHDCGDYLDVVIEYDANVRQAVEYAFRVEREAPSRWNQ